MNNNPMGGAGALLRPMESNVDVGVLLPVANFIVFAISTSVIKKATQTLPK
jgi:hypothetical protein